MKNKRLYFAPDCVRIHIGSVDLIAQSVPAYKTTFTFTLDKDWYSPIDGDLSPKYRNTLWEE